MILLKTFKSALKPLKVTGEIEIVFLEALNLYACVWYILGLKKNTSFAKQALTMS